jgi:acetyl-CoA C-acetyltransferase
MGKRRVLQKEIGLEKALGSIDRKKLNAVGSSVALGHPFAATGARIVASLSQAPLVLRPRVKD